MSLSFPSYKRAPRKRFPQEPGEKLICVLPLQDFDSQNPVTVAMKDYALCIPITWA
jgi:hypothetical protein